MKIGFRILTVLLILGACKRAEVPELDLQLDYLPLKVGASIDYSVDSIVYDDFDASKTVYSFILRETVVEQFEDAEGRTSFRIEQSKRFIDSTDFTIRGSYSLTIDGMRTERFSENKRIVNLVFPPKNDVE
jgi:hypothetical protein